MQERALVWLLVLIPLAACAANLPFVNDSPRYRVCMTGAYLIFVTGTTGGACVKIFCQV